MCYVYALLSINMTIQVTREFRPLATSTLYFMFGTIMNRCAIKEIFMLQVTTIYLAEVSDKDIRGALSVSSRFMFNLGNFLVMAVGPFVSYTTLNLMMLPLPIIYFIACWFIPETPYYSLKAGKVDQARKTLTKLRNYADDKVR